MKKRIIEIATELSKGKLTTKEAKGELLFLFGVVGRSKQLVCPNCKSNNTESDTSDIPHWCKDCGAEWAN